MQAWSDSRRQRDIKNTKVELDQRRVQALHRQYGGLSRTVGSKTETAEGTGQAAE
jgi:hypothetical protein